MNTFKILLAGPEAASNFLPELTPALKFEEFSIIQIQL